VAGMNPTPITPPGPLAACSYAAIGPLELATARDIYYAALMLIIYCNYSLSY